MENKAKIVFADKDLEMITVQCPGFKVIYITNYGGDEVDVCPDDGIIVINVFVADKFEDVLRKISAKIDKVNSDVDDGCYFVYTL